MKATRTVSRLLLLLPLVAIPVATVGARQHVPRTHSHVAEGSGWTELMGDMDRMHAAMASIEPSGIGDVDFVRLMLPHHQGAIDVASHQVVKRLPQGSYRPQSA
jgi:hypothetical protein